MLGQIRVRLERVEQGFGDWAGTNGVAILRVALGIVFVWFGVLKFCPGLCDVEVLAAKTMQLLTLGLVPVKICLALLAVAETGIGAMLIAGRAMRTTTICLMLHLCGTFLPMILFPDETWKHFPYAPTLVGQYILKNMVLMAAAVVVGAAAFATARAPRPVRPLGQFGRLRRRSRVLAFPSPVEASDEVMRYGTGPRFSGVR